MIGDGKIVKIEEFVLNLRDHWLLMALFALFFSFSALLFPILRTMTRDWEIMSFKLQFKRSKGSTNIASRHLCRKTEKRKSFF
jgi:hypothetical protein